VSVPLRFERESSANEKNTTSRHFTTPMSVATPERLHLAALALVRASASDDDAIVIPAPDDARPASSAVAAARPLSAADYFDRLRSFASPLVWFDKPPSLSAKVCASHGWCALSHDVLRCRSCDAALAYPNVARASDDVKESIARAFADALRDEHREFCAWRNARCGASVTGFPRDDDARATEAFARRFWDGAANATSMPFLVSFRELSNEGVRADVDVVEAVVRRARERAEEDGFGAFVGDVGAAERSLILDNAATLALFGWNATCVDEKTKTKDKRQYCCALCGVNVPEWTFTAIAKARNVRARRANAVEAPRTTAAALRGAAGGSFGLRSSASAMPFAPKVREVQENIIANAPKSSEVTSKWIAATANVASRLRASIAGGGAATSTNTTPFGARASPQSLFGAPRPVTVDESAPAESSSGDRLASVVVAAMTKKLAAGAERKRAAADVKITPPSDAVCFHVIKEHMHYCPWIATSASEGDPGWKITLEQLARATSSEDEDERRARHHASVDLAKARDIVRKYINA